MLNERGIESVYRTAEGGKREGDSGEYDYLMRFMEVWMSICWFGDTCKLRTPLGMEIVMLRYIRSKTRRTRT